MTTDQKFSDPHYAVLAAILRFTPDDLASNRVGALTDRQIKLLRRDTLDEYGLVLGLFTGLLLMIGCVLVPSTRPTDDSILFILGGFVLLLMVGVVYQLIRERRGIAQRVVESTTLEKTPDAEKGYVHRREFFANKPGSRLFADGDLSFVLEPEQTYRAYYVAFRSPATDFRILSLEPIDELFE